ncbi:MAG TPA: hypothetical protein VL947_03520, partial [Cytophagales bacterium]|nr:hypothetical protein [Cytophagales bacterium]
MLKIKFLAFKASVTLLSFFALAPSSFGQTTIRNNATAPPRDWTVIQTDISPASYGAPVITRVGGGNACIDNTNDIQSQATFSVSIPNLNNPSYTWSVLGDLELVSFSGNQATVRFKKRAATGLNRPGKLVVDYTGTTSTQVSIPYTYQNCDCTPTPTCSKTCTTTSGTTTYTDVNPQKGQASVNLVQKFVHNYSIVGPRCIAVGDTLTYSIAPLVSSYIAGDGYHWMQVAAAGSGFSPLNLPGYTSLDNSSITAKVVNSIPTSLSVNVGACNQAIADRKTITFGTKMPKPTAQIAGYTVKNPCLDASISQITLNVASPSAAIDYKWLSDIANTTVVSGALTSTSVTLNIGSNSGKIYLQASPKSGNGTFCTLNGPIYDTITI